MASSKAGSAVSPTPYAGVPPAQWLAVTQGLIKSHPLKDELVMVTLEAWNDIFETKIGVKVYEIGKDIKLAPQIMGNFLHELIPLILQDRHPGEWCKGEGKTDKDLVCLTDPGFSIEIKTSSDPSKIFGNRSYGQQATTSAADLRKKGKSGYYLAVNFEKFNDNGTRPKIVQIRFGWLDHSDWLAQKSPTGQQSRVEPRADATKLVRLYP